jgi:UDPglucose--hexose-1-phosphate uridylyltransferase
MNGVEIVERLLAYGQYHQLLLEDDCVTARNELWMLLGIDGTEPYTPIAPTDTDIYQLLNAAVDHCRQNGNALRFTYEVDRLYAALMQPLVPRNSILNQWFWQIHAHDPIGATAAFYAFSKATVYIRMDRIEKNISYEAATDYGNMTITINMTKPEKDPAEIALLKAVPSTGYPKCLLCIENSGYPGNAAHPARHQHRLISVVLEGEPWYFQFSPYVYYNEHAIVLSREHRDMVINRQTFKRLMAFVSIFPHYFIGSNADLPIVGGSILNHDHYQAGFHKMPMMQADKWFSYSVTSNENVQLDVLKWPVSVIRLRSDCSEALVEEATRIFDAWCRYTDENMAIIAETDTRHNTVTPIARRILTETGGMYELSLALRNNRTTETYPEGIFHPHREHHHIKKENIGLIEVMGLAVLPARLKDELSTMAEMIAEGGVARLAEMESDVHLAKHVPWLKAMSDDLEALTMTTTVDKKSVDLFFQQAVGLKFQSVLEDAGVFKKNRKAFEAFLDFVYRP